MLWGDNLYASCACGWSLTCVGKCACTHLLALFVRLARRHRDAVQEVVKAHFRLQFVGSGGDRGFF